MYDDLSSFADGVVDSVTPQPKIRQIKRRFVYPLQTLFIRQLLMEQETKNEIALRVAPWMYTICVAILIGWLTWQTLVANFSRPNCQYYRTQ